MALFKESKGPFAAKFIFFHPPYQAAQSIGRICCPFLMRLAPLKALPGPLSSIVLVSQPLDGDSKCMWLLSDHAFFDLLPSVAGLLRFLTGELMGVLIPRALLSKGGQGMDPESIFNML